MAASSVIDTLADSVVGMRLAHPIRVGLDGRSAAGKTTLADAVADALRRRRRDVLRASLDDFQRPGHKYRSERGE
jgi:uridine kinase